jgi:hypothetical protein
MWSGTVPISMSADGRTLLGMSGDSSLSNFVFGFWLPNGDIKPLDQVFLEQGLASSFAGWKFDGSSYSAFDLSADARALKGIGINPNGVKQLFVAYLDRLAVPEPTGAVLGLLALSCIACSRRAIACRRGFTTRLTMASKETLR